MKLIALLLVSFSCQAQTVLILYSGPKEHSIIGLEKGLISAGYLPEIVDTPCSGDLSCWRRLRETDFLGYADSVRNRIAKTKARAVIGVSRYGYLALLVASGDKSNTAYVAISPVVNLLDLQEFKGAAPTPTSDIRTLASTLQGKDIFIAIGKLDTRVNTASSIGLAQKVPSVSLRLADSEGHNYPDVNPVVVDWLARRTR